MNDFVKICMVGAGRVGKQHSGSLVNSVKGCQVVAIVDPLVDVLTATADEYGIPERYPSLEEAIERSQFDAVVIATPTPTHRPLAVTAARAGKHIFLEKPMALTLEDCDLILKAVQENGVLFQIGYMRRFDPDFMTAYQRIQAGEIGQPMMIKTLTHGPGLPPLWARDPATGGGVLAEVNSHDWDTLRYLMGANLERVYTEVANFKGKALNVDYPYFYDNVMVNLRFENGALGSLDGICPCEYEYDARVEIIGEKGLLQIGELKGQTIVVATNRQQGMLTPVFRTWAERFRWGYINEMRHFVECVLKGETPRVGGEDGRWAVAGYLAGTKSYREERPVYLKEILQSG
jgi:myo-inositol 2-dehydrogenase/D-chiro-inositol 1-dehydrogenase/scyllo-inositol 2-dehydrogenase (NAD+)